MTPAATAWEFPEKQTRKKRKDRNPRKKYSATRAPFRARKCESETYCPETPRPDCEESRKITLIHTRTGTPYKYATAPYRTSLREENVFMSDVKSRFRCLFLPLINQFLQKETECEKRKPEPQRLLQEFFKKLTHTNKKSKRITSALAARDSNADLFRRRHLFSPRRCASLSFPLWL